MKGMEMEKMVEGIKGTIEGSSYARGKVVLVGLLLLVVGACQPVESGGDLDVVAGGDRASESRTGFGDENGEEVEEDTMTAQTCADTSSCPSDTMAAVDVFKDPEGFSHTLPSTNDLDVTGTGWANQLSYYDGGDYDLNNLDRFRITANYILIKDHQGDRVLATVEENGFIKGQNLFHVAKKKWLTMDNFRWIGTHTAAVDVCVFEVNYCRTMIEIVSEDTI